MHSPSGDGPAPRRACTHQLRRILANYWATALEDYRQAGMPFGTDDKSFLIWFKYGQYTTPN